MSQAITTSGADAAAAGDGDLAIIVAELLAPTLARAVSVESVTRQSSPFATLFPADVLSVCCSDGRQIRLFLKHLGSEQADHPDKQCRDREVRVYEELLRDDALPVARYFGSRLNEATRRHELYLEYVDDWTLRHHGLQHWYTAARRLADFHAHFAARSNTLRDCGFLLNLDESYFADWAGRAHAAVAQQSAELGSRMEKLCFEYGPACALLAHQPATLVHNDLACKNVIADRSCTPARICIIDWELAGIGCGLLDLVHLKYGLDAASEQQMLGEYRSQLRLIDLLPGDDHEFARLLAACELHKTHYRLAHSPAWKLPMEKLACWVGEAELFLQRAIEA